MSVRVGHLYKNRIVKDMNGQIIDWFDEANGGWIIQKRMIVNQAKWNEHVQKEKDKQEAARAITQQKVDTHAPDRNIPGSEAIKQQSKVESLEKRIDAQDAKLDAILAALKK